MPARNTIQVRRGYSMGYSGAIIGSTPLSGNTWTGGIQLAEGELGYEINTGRFKIGRRNASGVLITWENLDYAGGGGLDGGVIPGSGIGILVNASGDDTIYSILTNDANDTNISITSGNITDIIPSATGFYYKLGLADSLSNIENIEISGILNTYNLVASGHMAASYLMSINDFETGSSGIINIGEFTSLIHPYWSISQSGSGNFANLSVNDTPVSLEGHTHVWNDIDTTGSGFCEDVGNCVNTQIIGNSGVQLVYSSGNNTLSVTLSGEALAQHRLNSTGFVSRSGTESYVTRSIVGGSNIGVTNGDGLLGNPTVALSGTVTGLTSVTATSFSGDLSGNASSASQVKTTSSTSSSQHYLAFVDSNNGSATAETVYTASGIRYIPSTDTLIVGNLSGVSIQGTSSQADTIKTLTASDNNTYYLTFVDSDNSSPGAYESLRTDAGIIYNPSSNLATFAGDINASGASITNNLVVGGNLTVNGTTVTANVDNMIVEDPVIVLGRPSGVISDDTKDRGIEIVWSESTVAKTGFFGWDRSANEFIAARDVTITDNTISNITYLDAKFKDIDGSVITASSQFSGAGSGLTGTASSLIAGKATNLDGGAAGRIPYQTGPGATTFLSIGTSGQYLRVNNGATAPEWDTLSYIDISGTPTIGDGTLSLAVSGSGLSGSATFTANQTGNTTFTVTSNATHVNTSGTLVSRDSAGSFAANIITASLNGTATNALNIEVDTNNTYLCNLIFVNGTNGNLKPYVNNNLKFDAGSNILYGTNYSASTTPTTKIEYFILDGGSP
jgi:hypothetical protein